jgi:hypothetical protein
MHRGRKDNPVALQAEGISSRQAAFNRLNPNMLSKPLERLLTETGWNTASERV